MVKPSGFKDILGYEGLYAISKSGQVYSYPKSVYDDYRKSFRNYDGLILKTTKYIYEMVGLHKNGKFKTATVHRLVALTWLPNPENKQQVNHKDHNKLNNSIENLEWCTRSENMRYQRVQIKKTKSSIYKGVWFYKRKNRYFANIGFNNKQIKLGSFKNEKDAAMAYNKKAIELHGRFAILNSIN